MRQQNRSDDERATERGSTEDDSAGAGGLQSALRTDQSQLDDSTRAWLAELAAANAALRDGMGASTSQSLSEALARLERLEASLHQASHVIVEHVGRRTAVLAAAIAQLHRIDELKRPSSSSSPSTSVSATTSRTAS